MKGKRIVLAGIVIIVLVIAGVFLAPVILRRSSSAASADARPEIAKPTTAFELKNGELPNGWQIASRSTEYLNLANNNGCFTTSALTVAEDYAGVSSIDSFKDSFVPKFTAKGYGINAIAARNLDVTTADGVAHVSAIYYELTQNNETSYHIDGGVKGTKNTAFMSVACGSEAGLADAQTALLSVTYDGSYVPLSNAQNTAN